MKTRSSTRTRLRSAAVAICSAVVVLLTGTTPAHAIDPVSVASSAASAAYEAFKSFRDGGLTLGSATQQILSAINQARTDILNEIGGVEAGRINSCARSAFIDLEDLNGASKDTAQAIARDATGCVEDAGHVVIDSVSSKAAVDQVGFALNSVGPIALFARVHAGFTTPALTADLIDFNERLMSRLKPSCSAKPLWGDAEPGGTVEVSLVCTAFDGTVGRDFVLVPGLRRGDPLPSFNFSKATARAMKNSSWTVAKASLIKLRATP